MSRNTKFKKIKNSREVLNYRKVYNSHYFISTLRRILGTLKEHNPENNLDSVLEVLDKVIEEKSNVNSSRKREKEFSSDKEVL